MKVIRWITALILLVGSTSYAQNAGDVFGEWTGTAKAPSTGADLQIRVVIAEAKSSWRFSAPGSARRASSCFDRDLPLSIQPSSNEKYTFNIDGSSLIQGCPAFSVMLVRTDAQTLSGTFGDGRPVVLKKN
jgi:hypothetical protein